jgi:hypothetical protein
MGAIVLWLLVGLVILSTLGRAASTSTTSAPSSGSEALGRLVAMIGFPIAAAVGAILLHRRRGRLLRQAGRDRSPGHFAPGFGPPGHIAQPVPPPHQPPPIYPGPHQQRPNSR